MSIRVPQQGKFSQPNNGDIFGNIKSSLNVDLRTNPGRVRISPRMKVITKDDDVSNFGLPIGFETIVVSNAEVVIAATGSGANGATGTGKAFANTAVGFGAFTAVASSPSTVHHEYSDMVSCALKETNTFKRIYISMTGALGAQDISQFDGSTWNNTWFSSTRSGTGLTNDSPTHLCDGFNGQLYIGNESTIRYAPITGNIVGPSSTTDPNTTAGTIQTLGKYIITWIRSSSNRLWVGLTEASSDELSHQGGYVAEWDATGTSFNKIYKIDAPMAMSCVIKGDTPYIIDAYGILKRFNGTGFTEVARLPVANLNIEMPGIYTQYSNARWIHPRGMDLINGQIGVLVNNFVSTGVYVDEMPSGLWIYDEKIGFYHQNSPCSTSDDYGQQLVEGVGALFGLKKTAGNFLAGVSYYTDDATTNRKAIFYDDVATNSSKRGNYTLPFVSSDQIDDTWQKVSYRHSAIPSGDKIIGKYRTGKNSSFPFIASATWTSTTTFTSTDSDFANVSGGEEAEPVMGKGASTTAHVSSISEAGGTYTITLDEAIGFSSGTFKVKMDNFKKMGTLSAQNDMEGTLPIGDTATKVQIKTEIRATGNFELDDLTLINTNHKLAR